MSVPSPRPGSRFAVLSESAFLAASWTWCIGMFLPVLLVRDFGVMGWVVFAVPNCLGAALMGVMLSRPGAVERVLNEHALAVRVFSFVTTAFQWFFAAWLLQTLGLGVWGLVALVVFIAVLSLTPGEDREGGRLRRAGVAALIASLALGVVWWVTDTSRVPIENLPAPLLKPGHLPPLAAVCAIGFFLCPYLDITFLRSARRAQARAGSAGVTVAFLAGFLLVFPLMIVMTLLYAPTFIRPAADIGTRLNLVSVPWLIAFHMIVQLGFTIAAHERGAEDEYRRAKFGGEQWRIAAFVVGLALAFAVRFVLVPSRGVMTGGEVVYRCFMAFYGLVFPAYVWICAWPVGEARGPGKARIGLAAIAVAAAGPFYWWGFLDQRAPMLWWGVGIVIVAGLIARVIPGERGHSGPDGAEVPAPLRPSPGALSAHAVPQHAGGAAES